MEDAHAKSWEEVVNYFGLDPERGLTSDQVKKYQEKYGPNGESWGHEYGVLVIPGRYMRIFGDLFFR